LKYLNIERNSIKIIPEELSQLTCLEELIIGHNNIDIFPQPIYKLLNLKKLDILNDRIKIKLTIDLTKIKSLESLCCTCTTIEFKNIISKMTWLKELEILSEEFIFPCLLINLTNIEKFKMILDVDNFEFFECSLVKLIKLKEFSIIKNDCCWPYIQI